MAALGFLAFTTCVKLSLPERFGDAAPFKGVAAFAQLSRDEVEAVKETAHVRIGVFGLHHAGHLVAVEGGSKSSSTDPSQEKLTDGLGSNHLIKKVGDDCLKNNLSMEGVTSSLITGVSATCVPVACAVGHIHLEAVIKTRVDSLIGTPDCVIVDVIWVSVAFTENLALLPSTAVCAIVYTCTGSTSLKIDHDSLAGCIIRLLGIIARH